MDIKPQNHYNAVLLINADINLEFEAPLDYVEPDYKKTTQKQEQGKPTNVGIRIDNKELKQQQIEVESNDYDPRLKKISKGIRKEWFTDNFQGTGVSIGRR